MMVIDDVAPEVVFDGGKVIAVKKGGIAVLPKYTVSDNITDSKDITVEKIVRNPNGRVWALDNKEDSFYCDFVGEYELRMIFIDQAGNTTMEIFTVLVTE